MSRPEFSFKASWQVVSITPDGRVIFIGSADSAAHAKALAAEREGAVALFRSERPARTSTPEVEF